MKYVFATVSSIQYVVNKTLTSKNTVYKSKYVSSIVFRLDDGGHAYLEFKQGDVTPKKINERVTLIEWKGEFSTKHGFVTRGE